MRTKTILGAVTMLAMAGACGGAPSGGSAGGPIVLSLGGAPSSARGAATPQLAPAIAREDAKRIHDEFAWSRTAPVAERNADGTPALYYALVYLRSRADVDALDQIGIHHSFMPLLPEEHAAWRGRRGTVQEPTDGAGIFRFAVLPGATYNAIRQYALAGATVFSVVQLRDLPARARGESGALSYDFLRQSGFQYGAAPKARPRVTSGIQIPSGIGTIHAALQAAAQATESVTEGIAEALAWVDQNAPFVGAGSATLTLQLDLRNTDPGFGGAVSPLGSTAPDTSTPMTRAWGAHAGSPITLQGVPVTLWQDGGVAVGFAPTLSAGVTDDTGAVALRVTRERPVIGLCVGATNQAALVTSFLTEVEVCDFASFSEQSISYLNANAAAVVQVQDPSLNVLAEASEGHAYLHDVVGFEARQAQIMVGPIADELGQISQGAAFTPCFAFPNAGIDVLLATALATLGTIDPAATSSLAAIAPVLAVDMFVPANEFPLTVSRGVVTHEYGHFALCSLLYASDPSKITVGYTEAMLERISNGGAPSPTEDAAFDNEAFADFFAAQVVGGVAYFGFPQAGAGMGVTRMTYCNAGSSQCMDANLNGTETGDFAGQVGRVATTIHDAFDGQASWASFTPSDTPDDASGWVHHAFLQYQPGHGDAHDEVVVLPGSALQSWVSRMATLEQIPFESALVATMQDAGFDYCQICHLYAQHDPSFTPSTGTAGELGICATTPIVSFLGPAPDATNPASCNFAGCPAGTGFDPSTHTCTACPAGTVPIGGSCQACTGATVIVGDSCQPCPSGELVYQGTCVTQCPPPDSSGTWTPLNGVCVYVPS